MNYVENIFRIIVLGFTTLPRIEDLQDAQDPYDLWQKQNTKDRRKELAKVLTIGKSKGHYKIIGRHYLLQLLDNQLFVYSADKLLFMNNSEG